MRPVSVNLVALHLICTVFAINYYADYRKKDYAENGGKDYDVLLWVICCRSLILLALITSSIWITIGTTHALLTIKKVIRLARCALNTANKRILVHTCCAIVTASIEGNFDNKAKQ